MPRTRRETAGVTRPRKTVAATLPPLVDLPTGNVHIIPAQRRDSDYGRAPAASATAGPATAETATPDTGTGTEAVNSTVEGVDTAGRGWLIYDGRGTPLGPSLDNRAAALRHMGVLAHHGASLPLTLHGPDGRPTGDRLP